MNTLKLISRPKFGPIRHYGVLIGDICMQLTPMGFQECSLQEFCEGQQTIIEKEVPYSTTVETRLRNFRPTGLKYDLFKFNCEHFARYLVEGEARSDQVQKFALVFGVLALIFITSK